MRKSILHRIRRDRVKYVSFLMCIIMVSVSINFSGLEGKVYADNSSSNKEQKTINEKREKLLNGYNKVKKSKKDNEKCEEVKELKSLRTSNSNTYLMSDGSRKLEIFSEKIRFKDNGKYKSYDTLLKNMTDSDREKLSDKAKLMGKNKKGDYILVNCEGNSKQYFPINISEDSYIILSKKDYGLSFAPSNINDLYRQDESDDNVNESADKEISETTIAESEGNESKIKEKESTTQKQEKQKEDKSNNETNSSLTLNTEKEIADKVSYCSEDKRIKYNYKSLKHGVKEEIIINEKPDTNVLEFNLCLSNLKVASNEYTNDIRFLDEETDKLVAYMDEPFVTDKNGNVNYNNIRYKVGESEDGYKIQIEIDKKYLEYNDTKYPITIDPTAIWTDDKLESATVSSLSSLQNTNLKNTSSFRVNNKGISALPNTEEMCFIDTKYIDRNSTSYGSCNSFYGSQIQSANLYVTEQSSFYQIGLNNTGYLSQGHVDIKRPYGSSWDVNTITWNNKPSLHNDACASFTTSGTDGTLHTINVKDWAQQVADRDIANRGLVLKARETGTGANFYASDATNGNNSMKLEIVYKPSHTGDSSIYSYESFDTANGSGKVELNQGNLYYEQKDFDLPSNQLNLGLDRVYNSINMEQGSFGVGWRCNYEGEIKDVTSDYIVYKDGTGAYFEFDKNNQNEWKCLENEDLSIEIATTSQSRTISGNTYSFTSEYVITDKEKTKRYFDGDKKLRLIEDANGNFLYIKYHSTYKIIEKIYSSAGQYIEMNYTTWNNEHFIGSIALADGSSFNYSYTNDRLTSVTHIGNDYGEITYEYEYNSSGKLKKIIDAEGYFYTVGYDGTSVEEVKYPNNDKFEVFTNYEPSKTRVYKKNSDNDILSYETFEFDNDGKVLKTTNDIGNETTYTYHNCQVEKSVDKVQYYKLQNGVVTLVTPSGIGDDKHLEENNTYNSNGDIISEIDEEGNITEYTYGDSNNPSMPTKTKVTDAEDVVTSEEDSEYDTNGNLTREIDEIKNTVSSYTVDNNGNVTKETDVLIDDNPEEGAAINSLVSTGLKKLDSTSNYDQYGNDTLNQTTEGTVQTSETNTYNNNNSQVQNILGRITSSTDEKGITTSYTYDEFGRVITTTVTIPNKPTEVSHTSYDENGRVTEEIDKYGRHTTYQYDSMGRITSKVLSYGNESKTTTTSYGYEENLVIYPGNGGYVVYLVASVITERNENNEVVSKKYNDFYGKLIREENLGVVSDYTYDKQGNVFSTYSRGISNTNPSSPKVTLTLYDKNGRLTDTIQNPACSNGSYVIDSSTIVTSNVYDDAGNLIQEKDAKGNITSYEYNAEGKVTKVSLPDDSNQGNNTVYAYDIQNEDASHNIISTKDTTTNAKGNISETEYNGGGQVLSITDKGTNSDITTTYEYDTSGNKTKEITSDGRHISYSYNEKNQMISASHVSTNNVITRYSTYEYNSDDLLYKVVDYKQHNNNQYPYKYTYYEYDDFGKAVGFAEINASSTPSQSTIDDHLLTYTYDIEDKLTEIRYPKTTNDTLKGIKLYYNSNKWLTSIKGIISENNEEIERNVRTYDYYNDSKIKTIRDYRNFLSGGSAYINKEYQYDVFDRVTSMEYRDSSNINTILEKHTYSYDKNNNILSEGIINNYPQNTSDRINETREYTYDDLNRLKTSKYTDNNTQTEKNTSYSYDNVGNITRIEEDSKVTVNTYNEFNQLITSVISNNNTLVETKNFTYDANGNQTREQTLDDNNDITETITKSYDNEGHMTRWSCYNGGTNGSLKSEQLNTYNNDGKRCLRVDDEDVNDSEDVKTKFFYQGDNLLYTTDGSGNKKSQNIVGPDNNIIATVQYDDGQHAYFYNKDIRTSVTNIVDESGNGAVRYQYDDFGETTKLGDTDFYNEICYTSGVYDELTKEYYLNARFYDPEDRVFTTQDSYRGEQKDYNTWNMYAYCGGNPINSIDPSGHMAEVVLYGYGAANCWNPSGWIALAAATAITIGTAVTVYYAGKKIKGVVSAKSKNGKKIKVKKVKAKKSPKKNNRQGNNKNNSNKPTNKVYKVKDKGRIDVEYKSANKKLTGIHYHAPNGIKYLLYRSGEWIARNGNKPTKSIRKIMKSDYFQKALRKARDFLYK